LLPKFKYQGIVESRFGLALLKIFGDCAAAVTSSGTKIELWFMGAQARRGKSFAQIELDTVATAIYLDEEYPPPAIARKRIVISVVLLNLFSLDYVVNSRTQ
jgi:hypothetical protein